MEERLVLSPDVVWRRLGETVILCRTSTGEVSQLNNTAAFIWECAAGASLRDLSRALQVEYSVNDADATEYVDEFVANMVRSGLMIFADSPRPPSR